ncbi:EAL domain-containing protein [Leeia sp. TBRC 13508]|uniref:EAL domain-containing protein n=1 Tax=Leeia speluncae TaxID=2884804 RepID=A0ABS8D4Y3_9NEIS|nr:GGDEF domain-containing phosphodiesterase [Leeia speluncae]MCB6183227.1 EAL domain-containing protein [Leeia speluncae]
MSVIQKTSTAIGKLHRLIGITFILLSIAAIFTIFNAGQLNHQEKWLVTTLVVGCLAISYLFTIYQIRRKVIFPLGNLRRLTDELISFHLKDENPPHHPDALVHLHNAFLQLSNALESSRSQVEQQTQLLKKSLDQWRSAEKTLNKLGGRLQLATQATAMGIWDWYLEENTHEWDTQTFQFIGIPDGSITPSLREWLRRVHPADLPKLQNLMEQLSFGHLRQYKTDYRILLPDNSIRQLALFAKTTLDEMKNVVRITTVQMDITEQKLSEKRIIYLATHDQLTGLYSRSGLKEMISKTIQSALHDDQFAILHVDLDRFKNVNDALGHVIGDELIQQISVKLSRLLRKTDAIARFAGDEFVILFTPINRGEEIEHLCRRLMEVITFPHTVQESEVSLTASIGYAVYPADGADAETLIRHADISMQIAKTNGGNLVQPFTHSMVKDVENQLDLEQKLRRAIELERLEVFFQPKVDTLTRIINGAEALVRWPKAEGGYISPANFIPLAEERGLIQSLNLLVLHKTLRHMQQWQAEKHTLVPVSVNLSADHFSDPRTPNSIEAILKQFGIAPKFLQLEITEGMLLRQSDQIERNLKQIRELGVEVSIDDFGTGYSSLSYLHQFKVDNLKLDRSFIAMSGYEQGEVSLVPAIINIAHSLNLSVTAEGVETIQQYDFLKLNGCDQIQGFLFAKPMPAEEFAGMLEKGMINL